MIKTIKNKFKSFLASFFAGSIILSLMSLCQKIIAGYKIIPRGFIVPIIYGGITASIVWYFYKKQATKSEQNLQESEERFRSLYESMEEGVCLHEVIYDENEKAVDYKIIDINPRYEDISGIKRTNAVDTLASEVYNSDKPPYLDKYSKVAETGDPIDFETYYPPMDKY
ncbi:MAG: PAS domain-containing protein, partial [Chloroflexota bacterium]|nr:PAS domain-containing protein [Chloroflexota bacterium]